MRFDSRGSTTSRGRSLSRSSRNQLIVRARSAWNSGRREDPVPRPQPRQDAPLRGRASEELSRAATTVVVTAAHKRNKPLKLGVFSDNTRVDVVPNPVRRLDDWEPFVRPLRQARDYLRFLDPSYANAAEAGRARARLRAAGLGGRLRANGALRPPARRSSSARSSSPRSLVPSERVLRALHPLARAGRRPGDAARRLRLVPDRLRQERASARHPGRVSAVQLGQPDESRAGAHRARSRARLERAPEARSRSRITASPPERVVVTGAPRFDDFFAMRPSTTRDGVLRAGAGSTRRVRSCCISARRTSSRPTKWRSSAGGRARCARRRSRARPAAASSCGRIPPTPSSGTASISRTSRTPPSGRSRRRCRPIRRSTIRSFTAAAVVGLNTSAMIEAGILGKSVYTIETAGVRRRPGADAALPLPAGAERRTGRGGAESRRAHAAAGRRRWRIRRRRGAQPPFRRSRSCGRTAWIGRSRRSWWRKSSGWPRIQQATAPAAALARPGAPGAARAPEAASAASGGTRITVVHLLRLSASSTRGRVGSGSAGWPAPRVDVQLASRT